MSQHAPNLAMTPSIPQKLINAAKDGLEHIRHNVGTYTAIGAVAIGHGAAAAETATAQSPSPIAAGAILPPEATASSEYSNSPLPSHLLQPEELPGHNIGVSRALQRLHTNSTVKIYYNAAGGKFTQSPVPYFTCTGTKINVNSKPYISTAGHCLSRLTGIKDGILSPDDYPQAPALDFLKRTYESTYSIGSPRQATPATPTPDTVSGISVNTRANDAALLELTPEAPFRTTQSSQQSPALSMISANKPHLIPGQKVGLGAVPGSNEEKLVESTGIYLGRMTVTENANASYIKSRQLDIVITYPDQPWQDACYYGASGSSFVAQEMKTSTNGGTHGKMVISGPLSRRLNTKYDPYILADKGVGQKVSIQNSLAYAEWARAEIGWKLGVEVGKNATICEYSVVPAHGHRVLAQAIGNYAPEPPAMNEGGKGGDGSMK